MGTKKRMESLKASSGAGLSIAAALPLLLAVFLFTGCQEEPSRQHQQEQSRTSLHQPERAPAVAVGAPTVETAGVEASGSPVDGSPNGLGADPSETAEDSSAEASTAQRQTSNPSVPGSPEPGDHRADAASPRDAGVVYSQSETCYGRQEYELAAQGFREYADLRPENPWGHYMLGLSLWKSGDLEGAEAALRRSLELAPRHLKSHLNLARVLLDGDHPQEALESAKTAAGIDPLSADARRLMGRAFHNLGQAREAEDAYLDAAIRNDRDAWSRNNLGLLFLEQEEFERAVPPLSAAVRLDGGVAVFRNNLGVALERTGRPGAAAEQYQAALEIDPGLERAAVSLARVEQLAGPDRDYDLESYAQRFHQSLLDGSAVTQAAANP